MIDRQTDRERERGREKERERERKREREEKRRRKRERELNIGFFVEELVHFISIEARQQNFINDFPFH